MRIGLLGAAKITSEAIVEPAATLPNVTLQGIATRDPRRSTDFADEHGIATVFDSYSDLVSSPDIDLVYNALPVSLHAKWSIAALQNGKHVLCEKPLAMNAAEVGRMLVAAEVSGARLIEAFHYRYHPAFITFLKWIAEKRIGEIQKLDSYFNVAIRDDGTEIRHRPETGGGAMMDLGCYPVHWVRTVMDAEPVSISVEAVLTPSGVDESMLVQLTFDGNVMASVSASMAEGQDSSSMIHVLGERGEISFENPLKPYIGSTLVITMDNDKESATIDPRSTYHHQLSATCSALGNGELLPTEGQCVLHQQKVLDRIYAAAGLSGLRSFPTLA